ncbi:MAG: aldo/keto reductase [Deltaproteobacteria bacterium]|nr:aldo/keto reductase [Deltaproteobacteria bacterium]
MTSGRPRVRLGNSPVEIVPLGVGCWAWGDREYWRYEQDHGPREVVDAFAACLDAGLDFYDTAESYGWGKSEKILGALVRKCGRALVVTTKYAPLGGRGGPAAIPQALEKSLKRLGLPQLDLYQLHWPDSEEVPIAATMEVFAEAVKAGKTRAVGVSNFSAAEMHEAYEVLARRGVPLASNQVHYSLLHRAPEADGVVEACRELGVTLLAYSPLEQGLLSGKYTPENLPSGPRAESEAFTPENVAAAQPLIAKLRELAATHGVDAGTIAIAWLLAKPGVVPLPGAKSGEQAARNAKALDVVLSATDVSALDHLSAAWCKAEEPV